MHRPRSSVPGFKRPPSISRDQIFTKKVEDMVNPGRPPLRMDLWGGVTVNFHVLGPVQILDGQQPVAVDGAKARALLACLLIHANTVVSTDRLVEYLWGDRPPRSCLETLYAYVSRLRRLLGPGILATRPPAYQLTVEAERLDATYFEVLLGRGRVAARNGRPGRRWPRSARRSRCGGGPGRGGAAGRRSPPPRVARRAGVAPQGLE